MNTEGETRSQAAATIRRESAWPDAARAVIVGGGVAGCSVAYHLGKLGWKDVVLLEQGSLAGGTSWHAAGLVGQLRASNSLTRLNRHSVALYRNLSAETGCETGWNEVGSLVVASSAERMCQLQRTAAMAKVFGVEAHLVGPAEAGTRWPGMRTDDLRGAVWLPHDGKVSPEGIVQALAAGARRNGVAVFEGVRVEEILMNQRRACGVRTDHGTIRADWVILCGGMWTRQLGLQIGVDLPLYPVEHHYVVSEPLQDVEASLPVGRDPDEAIYFRSQADGAVVLGAFQKESLAWDVERVPDDFRYKLLDPDWGRYAEPLRAGKHRLPILEGVSFPKFVNGPESFTPDNNFLMGEPVGTEGLFVLAGFNSAGIASAGGAGCHAAEWLENGGPAIDLWSVDVRRFVAEQNRRSFLCERVTEVLGLHYRMAWPNRELTTGRGLRRTALYDRLRELRACFGSVLGWERPNWFAPEGVEPVVEYSFGRQNWAPHVAAEVRACRENVALFDQSTFGKYRLRGRDALALLQVLCGNNIDVAPGKTVYTGLFNHRGTFESDLVVARLGPEEFYLVTATGQAVRDFDWISRHVPTGADAELVDVTEDFGVLSVMGPNARRFLATLTSANLANESFPCGTAREIDVAGTTVLAMRGSYVGELGWELHTPAGNLLPVYDALVASGKPFGLRHAGHYAIDAMRLEMAHRAWGRDLTTDDTPLEAGLAFAIAWDTEFLGRDALRRQQSDGVHKRLLSFVLRSSDAVLWGGEPVLRNGESVGYTTSGAFSPTLGAAVALGYIRRPDRDVITREFTVSGEFSILCNGLEHSATAHLTAPIHH